MYTNLLPVENNINKWLAIVVQEQSIALIVFVVEMKTVSYYRDATWWNICANCI